MNANDNIIPKVSVNGVGPNIVCTPERFTHRFIMHNAPNRYRITFVRKISLALGSAWITNPNTMQASALPVAHIRNGMIPEFCAVCIPTINDPTPAHVAAIDIA